MVGVISGPGHHTKQFIDALKAQRVSFRYSVYWPVVKVFEVDKNGNEQVLFQATYFKLFEWFAVSVWKLNRAKNKKYIQDDILFTIYDLIVAKFFDECFIVVGWSQVSQYSLERAKKRGAFTILEHPMPDALFWQDIVEREYKSHYRRGNQTKSWRTSYMLRRMKKEYEVADKINLLSSFSVETFGSPFREKLSVTSLYSKMEVPNFAIKQASMEKKFVFLYVGRLELWKGVHYLMEAFLSAKLKDAELWMVGNHYNEFIIPKNDRIKYLGVKQVEELKELYTIADAFVFPTLLDAFGLVLLEALNYKLPIIATKNSGAPDIAGQGIQDCILVEPANAEELKKALEKVYYEYPGKNNTIPSKYSKVSYDSEIAALIRSSDSC